MRNIIPLFLLFQFLFFPCYGQVVINEVMPHTNNLENCEWIEIYNNNTENISLINYEIGDNNSNNKNTNDKFNLTIPAGRFGLIVDKNCIKGNNSGCKAFNISNKSCFELSNIGSGLNDDGDAVYLYDNASILQSNFTWNQNIKTDKNSWQRLPNNFWTAFPPSPGKRNFYETATLELLEILTDEEIYANKTATIFVKIANRGMENATNISVNLSANSANNIYQNSTKINLSKLNISDIPFNLIFNETGNYTIFAHLKNETISKNICVLELPPTLNLSVALDGDPSINTAILGITYNNLFKVINTLYKSGETWSINLSVNYWIYLGNSTNFTVMKNATFNIVNLNKQKTANTGNWTPNQTGTFTICGRIINATTTYDNTTVCKYNITVIDPITIPCNLTISIYAPIIWYNDEGSEYNISVNDTFGNYSGYPVEITYWIEDFFGNYLSRHDQKTSEKNVGSLNKFSYTPKLDCGTEAYWIKANITKPYCNNTNPKKTAQKLIVVIGDKKCEPCPDCPKCSSKKEKSKKKSEVLKIEILNKTKKAARNQEFTTTIKLKNKANKKITFEIYSHVYKGKKCITGSWTANKEEVSLNKGEEKIINLTNKIKKDAKPGEYIFRIRTKINHKTFDLTDKIRVTEEIVEDKTEKKKTKISIAKENPKLKIWNDTKLRINLSNCSNCKMIIVGPNTTIITGRKYRVFEDFGKYEIFVIKEGLILNRTYIWSKEQNFSNKLEESNKITGNFMEVKQKNLFDSFVSSLKNFISTLINLMEKSIK